MTYQFTPARARQLAQAREKARLKREREGTEPQRAGGRKRAAARAARAPQGGATPPPQLDATPTRDEPPAPRIVQKRRPAPTPPPAASEPTPTPEPSPQPQPSPTPGARSERPSPVADIRRVAQRLRSLRRSG